MNPLKTKVIRTNGNNIFIFRYIHNSVYFYRADKNTFSPPTKVIENIWQCFSVCSNDRGIFLLCMGKDGIHLCFYDFEKWSYRLTSKNPIENCIQISLFIYETTVRLIYFTANTNKIFLTSANEKSPSVIAESVIFKGGKAFHIGYENSVSAKIFYFLGDSLKCRSLNISNGKLSEEKTVFTTNLPCTDYSVLTAENEIHILWLAGNSHKSMAVYKNIIKGIPSKAKVIFENEPCKCCSLFKYKNEIYAQFIGNKNSYILNPNKNKADIFETSDCIEKAEYMDYCSTLPLSADEVITEDFIYFPLSETESNFLPDSDD